MRPPRLTSGLIAGLYVLVGAGFLLQWQTNTALWQAIELGQSPGSTGAASGRSADAGTRSNPATPVEVELAQLRVEVNELRARTAAIARTALQSAQSSAPPLALRPSGAWKNSGRATPSEAAETLMWATESGDVQELAKSITLDPAAREKAQAMLESMSESLRKTYDTPEKLVALLLAREVDIRAMQVLGESTAGDDALVNVRLQKDDGKTKEEGMQFRRTSEGWRMAVSGKAMDKMGKKLNDPPKKDGKK